MTFEEIYRQNHQSVYVLANRMVNNREASEDIVQDVFIKLYKTHEKAEQVNNVGAWLSRVTYNHCINYLRNSKRLQNYDAYTFLSNAEGAEMKIIETEESVLINMVIKELKKKEQVLVRLYAAGISYREISGITGIKYSSVGTTLARTLKKIRKKYYEKESRLLK